MSDYAISSIKYEEQKKYSLLADIVVGIAVSNFNCMDN